MTLNEGRNLACNLRFCGQYEDEESGLFYNRFRYYSPETGQYLSPDPLGLAGGVNPYGYVPNPVSFVDPLGLVACPVIKQRVLDNIAASKAARESSSFGKNIVQTPYGPAIQSNAATALAARGKVENGATLYRIGATGRSEAVGAQFWALEHPYNPGYANKYGIPQENITRSNFIMTGELKPGANFITRSAPSIGKNLGGGIEVVVPPNAVNIKTFSIF